VARPHLLDRTDAPGADPLIAARLTSIVKHSTESDGSAKSVSLAYILMVVLARSCLACLGGKRHDSVEDSLEWKGLIRAYVGQP